MTKKLSEILADAMGKNIWTQADIATLKELAKSNTPTGIIALKLNRTEDAIFAKANEL